jgi:hypothetical protein
LIGSTGLAIYSSTSIYLSWQADPVLTTFGSDILPIHDLNFPSIILCSPGNNMAALPNVSQILSEEWDAFWTKTNRSILETYKTMSLAEQTEQLTVFVRHHIPGWSPDLTLEHFILYMTTHFPALRRTILLWEKEGEFRNKSVPVFDLILNPSRSEELAKELEKIDRKATELFDKMDFSDEKLHKIILSVLWFTAQPCHKLLTFCLWKGERVDCGKIFFPIPTDIGMCCAFNHNSLKKMLKGEKFAKMIQEIEEKSNRLEAANSIDATFSMQPETSIDFTPNWGIQNGLTVVIDAKSDWNPASVQHDFLGVQAAIKGKNQFPIISRDSFLLKPGHETYIAITATHTTAKENLRSLPIDKRKCFYKDENQLQLFNAYSVKNCWMESLTNFSRKVNANGCVPWNFPSADDDMPLCKPIERHRFLTAFHTAETNKFVMNGMARCLPNCGGTTYEMTVTGAPFRQCDQANMGLTRLCDLSVSLNPQKWGDLILNSYMHHGDGSIPDYIKNKIKTKMRKNPEDKLFGAWNREEDSYNAYQKDISVATFYFPRHTALELVKTPKMSTVDFLSQVGGIIGLCVGISLISFIEIIYWLSVKLANKTKKMCVLIQDNSSWRNNSEVNTSRCN